MNANERLTIEEAAAYIGYAPSYLRKLMMRGKIPYRKFGKRCFFFREDIDAAIFFASKEVNCCIKGTKRN
ncbi:DNA binding domain, excisionase family [Bacteroidales bacterium Barb6]|nr:DNA binding domain, excisionase family [Bacteroidales bacterium Barb6]OAV76233.1 DNA binding domain, excisionase family [Bacteroidales bacterium Barb7]